MMKTISKIAVCTALSTGFLSGAAYAKTIVVVIEGSQFKIMASHFKANEGLLANIASTNTFNHQSTTTAITAAINSASAQDRATSAQTTSTIQKTQEQAQELEELKRNQDHTEETIEKYGEPPSVCTTAESGRGTKESSRTSKAGGSGRSKGRVAADGGDAGGVSDQTKIPDGAKVRAEPLIKDELENGALITNAGPEAETLKDSTIYLANYCTDEERKLDSTSEMCSKNNPNPSNYPNGSVSFKSFQTGAGYVRHVQKSSDSEVPDIHRTLDPTEQVAANLFRKGLADDEAFTKMLTKEQTRTATGVLYFSRLKAFERERSIALGPFQASIEERLPSPGTRDLVKSMKDSAAAGPSAYESGGQTMWGTSAFEYYQEIKKSKDNYYRQVLGTAPPDVHEMSARELLAFDIERRYSNEFWYQEMAAMPSESPIDKEQTFMMAQSNYLLFRILEQLETNAMIQGATLMNLARQYHAPTLATLYEQVAKEALSTVGGANTPTR